MSACTETHTRIYIEYNSVGIIFKFFPFRLDKNFFAYFQRVKILLPVIRPVFFLHIVNMDFKSAELVFIIKLFHFGNSISDCHKHFMTCRIIADIGDYFRFALFFLNQLIINIIPILFIVFKKIFKIFFVLNFKTCYSKLIQSSAQRLNTL